ncbi:hypothetical protein IFM89_005991 [Coptis chinensis]|uniref:Glycosyltransferase n=1 Tax=Coptis chinensis TaxID=261450 RepID=A0A835IAA5_9MAGN|nr:hypothetical protein IFM89_005991 [Coptis chinensis]
MDSKEYDLHVLLFPWLAHGHISPFLELAKKLTQRNFYIYFCSTPINLSSIKNQVSSETFPSIQLVELHLPSLPNLPPQRHTTKSLPLHLQSTLKTALDMAKPAFLTTLKPDLLIYDFIQPWAPELASQHNIPAINFLTMGAAASSYLIHKFSSSTAETEFPLPAIYYQEHEYNTMAQMIGSYSNNVLNKDRFFQSGDRSSDMILVKTFGEIEAKYIEYLSFIVGKEILPVGLLVQEATNDDKHLKFVEWLDQKGKSSTVFVSFGTEYFMSREQMQEIAHGLELSEVNFIWVIRFPEGEEETKLHEALPKGFLEKIGERGMVVDGWAPQMKILAHPSIGGFVSHCGWSSVLEGMKLGVPIIAMPMHIDQPLNARLVVELGAGVEVERDKCGNGKLASGEMAKVIKQVVVEKGEVRTRMKAISENMRNKRDEEMNVVVEKLMRLCNNR